MPKALNHHDSITKKTHAYIMRRPMVRDCLGRGLINYSALAREISGAINTEKFPAVLAATQRLAARLSRSATDTAVLALIADTQIRVTNRLARAVATASANFDKFSTLQRHIRRRRGRFNMLDADDFVTLLFSQSHLPIVEATLGSAIQSTVTDLAQINIIFDKRIETTPGVVAHIYGLLAFNGINVREEMSCWTDIIIVVDERDLARTLEIIS